MENILDSSHSADHQHAIPDSPKKSPLGIFLVLFFGFTCFVFFLMLKLPEERIKNLITAHIKIESQRQGFTFSAESMKFGIFLGPSIKIINAEIKSLSEEGQKLKIDSLKIKPSLLSILLPFSSQMKKAYISAKISEGEMSGNIGFSPTETLVDLGFNKLNTGKISILKKYLPLDVSAILDGSIDVLLNSQSPNSSKGKIDLKLNSMQAPSQSMMGFNLPALSISQATLQAQLNSGRLMLSNVVLGKNINQDSLVATASGEIQLDKYLTSSKLTLKTVFDISKSVKDSFPILENLLAPAKLSDGKFSYQFTGPAYSPTITPGK